MATLNDFQFLRAHWMLLPNGMLMKAWSTLIILFTLWTAVSVPFQEAFFHAGAPPWWANINITADVIFVLDILVNFRVAYYRGAGTLETGARKVMTRYARSWLLLDFIGGVPWDAFASMSHNSVMVMRLIRLIRLGRLLRMVQALKMLSHWRIFQLYLVVCLVTHWMACW